MKINRMGLVAMALTVALLLQVLFGSHGVVEVIFDVYLLVAWMACTFCAISGASPADWLRRRERARAHVHKDENKR